MSLSLNRSLRAAAAMTAGVALAMLPQASSAVAADDCSYPAEAYESGAPLSTSGFPSDPLFAKQWGLRQINAPDAWSNGIRGGGAVIAVVDTGVDLGHPDLDDRLIPGRDFYTELTPNEDCPGPQDEDGHGTQVAGVAAASANNGIGVAGTAPNAKVMPLKVGGATTPEGLVDGMVLAIRYAADRGAEVINVSIGAPPWMWETLGLGTIQRIHEAVQYAWEQGSVIVAGAGNLVAVPPPEGVIFTSPLCAEPAAGPQIVCVAATDRRGLPAPYSSLPVQNLAADPTVALRAPGGSGAECENDEDVWTTWWPGAETGECAQGVPGRVDGYGSGSGTSLSSAFVSGVAALLAGKRLTNSQIVDCLKRTSSNKGAYDPVMGYGVVDAGAAGKSCV